MPRYQFGFNAGAVWNNFFISAFFQGVGKRDLWPNGPVFIPGWRQSEVWYDHGMDYWTPENPNAYYPRPTNFEEANGRTNSKNFYPQSKYLLNMAYLKIKNLAKPAEGDEAPQRVQREFMPREPREMQAKPEN